MSSKSKHNCSGSPKRAGIIKVHSKCSASQKRDKTCGEVIQEEMAVVEKYVKNMGQYRELHPVDKTTAYKCPKCQKYFKRDRELREHILGKDSKCYQGMFVARHMAECSDEGARDRAERSAKQALAKQAKEERSAERARVARRVSSSEKKVERERQAKAEDEIQPVAAKLFIGLKKSPVKHSPPC